MRNQLMMEIQNVLMSSGIDDKELNDRLIIVLSNYDVTSRTTEITVYDGDDIQRYIKLFLINKRVSGRTERTLKHYNNALNYFFSEVNKNPTSVTSDDIKLFIAEMSIKKKASPVYQQNMLRVISSFYAWMVRDEHMLKNPMNKVDSIKTHKIKKHAFTDIEVEKLRNSLLDEREKAIFELLLSTWCRVSEIAGINVRDINQDGYIDVIGKGQKMRRVYLNASSKIALDDYIKIRHGDNEALFVSIDKPYDRLSVSWIEKMCRELGKRAGVENCHPHRFRRTGATMALKRGMPILQVSKLLGHESIETTQIYLDISEDEIMYEHKKYV